MAKPSWQTIKQVVYERANGCCEYCSTAEINIGQTLHIEHIVLDTGDKLENLCLACPNCNVSKAAATTAVDPETNVTVQLFHPRHQSWADHFAWSEDFSEIFGLTPVGRATISRLKMNRPRIVLARQRWVQAGYHPVVQKS
ncbi:MAG: HNH endonuclease [Anaerolineaceae bacterium]|nr:HNH endonuclease [Anaerolineaceae bacterium]